MLGHLKLGTRFTLLLAVIFVGGIVATSIVLYQALLRRAEDEVATKSSLLLSTMNSVRTYTNGHVFPLLRPSSQPGGQFFIESIPTYALNQVFDTLKTNPTYAGYFYKDATLNPLNQRNRADPFETDLVQHFRAEPGMGELSGFRTFDSGTVFYVARPIAVKDPACLQCHTTPEQAPPDLVGRFGRTSGYGWQMNEIVATQIVYVPADEVVGQARQSFLWVIGIFAAIFALTALLINGMLRRGVIQPTMSIAEVAAGVEAEQYDTLGLTKIAQRHDELGQLARVFQRMVEEVAGREQRLKQEVQELRIKIDETQKAQQVSQVTTSDFFKDLKSKAHTLRQSMNTADDNAASTGSPPRSSSEE